MAQNRYVAGIDLGTSNCCVGIIRDGRVSIVKDAAGSRVTPSIIAFTKNGMRYGEAAKPSRSKGDANTIYEVKRIIGKKFSSPEVQDEIKNWNFKVVQAANDRPRIPITINGVTKYYCPEAISAKLISYLVDLAKKSTGGIINEIVITCPAYFSEQQRRATRDAGEIAGYEVISVLNEPAAAAIAYGFENKRDNQTILVYDLGGGTFDVTILKICKDHDEVLGYSGDSHCGGVDLDRIMAGLIRERLADQNIDFTKPQSRERVRQAAETVKILLSSLVEVDLDGVYGDLSSGVIITRTDLEDRCKEIFDKTIRLVKQLMEELGLSPTNIDKVVLIGGSSKIPILSERLSEIFGKEKISKQINPDEAVAIGATLYAFNKDRLSNPIIDDDDFFANMKEYIQRLDIPSTVTDKVPMSYGIEVENRRFSPIISRNTPLNKEYMRRYNTRYDNQSQFDIIIYQGEDPICTNNIVVGDFSIKNLPPGPAGSVMVDVNMVVDSDFMLHVSARVVGTEEWVTVAIEKEVTNLTEEEKELLKNNQKDEYALDEQERLRLQLVNTIETMLDDLKKGIEEKRSRMSMLVYAQIMHDINCASDSSLKTRSLEDLQALEEKLNQRKKLLQLL